MRTQDFFVGLLVAAIWGMGMVFAKAGVEHFPPILLMALRAAVASAILVWFHPFPYQHWRSIALISFTSGTLQFVFLLVGLKHTTASLAAIIIQLEVPMLVLIGAFFLREIISRIKVAGIVFSISGAYMLWVQPGVKIDIYSASMLLLGALAWAVGQVQSKKSGVRCGFSIAAWTSAFSVPQLLIVSCIIESGQVNAIVDAPMIVWMSIIYLGIVMTSIGYGLWYGLLNRYPVSMVGPFMLIVPIFSVIGAALWLGERPGAMVMFSGIIILIGLIVINFGAQSLRLINLFRNNLSKTIGF